MEKSILERIFPKPRNSSLSASPHTYRDESSHAPLYNSAPIQLSSNLSSRSSSKSRTLSDYALIPSAPLSASIIHHSDPFLAVNRAASNLQNTIQSLLDFQSQALSGRHGSSTRQPATSTYLPTSSVDSSSRQMTSSGVIPKRQPAKKLPTLKSTRRALEDSMRDFAILKEEEVRIAKAEFQRREEGLERIQSLDTKKEAVQQSIRAIQIQTSEGVATGLRQEADKIEQEIHELEDRLMELKARHRHLVNRADEVENTAASDMSSYQGTMRMIEKEVSTFLRHPPVSHGLAPSVLSGQQEIHDFYALIPERRTLTMAREQWTSEQSLLQTHLRDADREKNALTEGSKIWNDIVNAIETYEARLLAQMKAMRLSRNGSNEELVHDIDRMLAFLDTTLSEAAKKEWNLLVAAIGAEVEAFKRARELLDPEGIYSTAHTALSNDSTTNGHADSDDGDVPHVDLLSERLDGGEVVADKHDVTVNTAIEDSNESLKATLKGLQEPSSTDLKQQTYAKRATQPVQSKQYESEDDDPGPDFLVG